MRSIPGLEDSLEEGMVTHSSILACRIPLDRGVGYHHGGHRELDTTEQVSTHKNLWSQWVVSTLEVDRDTKKLKTPVWGRGQARSIFCSPREVSGRPPCVSTLLLATMHIIKTAQPWTQSCSNQSSAESLQASHLTCLCQCPHLKNERNNVLLLDHWGEHAKLGAHCPAGQGVPAKWKQFLFSQSLCLLDQGALRRVSYHLSITAAEAALSKV